MLTLTKYNNLSNFVSRRNFLKLTGTAAINKTKETITPTNVVKNQLQKVKNTAKNLNTVNNNLNELGKKGPNVSSRRSFLKGAKNKILIEAGKRPKNTNKVLGGIASKVKGAVSNINYMNAVEKMSNPKLGKVARLISKVM